MRTKDANNALRIGKSFFPLSKLNLVLAAEE